MATPTVDGPNAAPPKKPWNDDSPANTNEQWFPIASKWCRISSIHSSNRLGRRLTRRMSAENGACRPRRLRKLTESASTHQPPKRDSTSKRNQSSVTGDASKTSSSASHRRGGFLFASDPKAKKMRQERVHRLDGFLLCSFCVFLFFLWRIFASQDLCGVSF